MQSEKQTMALHQEFKIDPEQALLPAIKILEEAGVITEDNKKGIKSFLMQDVSHASNLALALIELKPVGAIIKNYKYKTFLRVEDVNRFLIEHAEYAPICARMAVILLTEEDNSIANFLSMGEFLSKNYTQEIKAVATENAQYAAQLALVKIKLKSASPLLQECLHEKYLTQSAY